MSEIAKTVTAFSDFSSQLIFTPSTGADYLVLDNADTRVALIVRNQNAQDATVTFKAGDGTLSPLGDVTVPVKASQTVAVPFSRVESARVKVISGADKGKVFISSAVSSGGTASNIQFAVLSVE